MHRDISNENDETQNEEVDQKFRSAKKKQKIYELPPLLKLQNLKKS